MVPFDKKEEEHLHFAKEWVNSGAGIFRLIKPATPDPHLVAYFLLLDPVHKKVLLVDHKKASLWLSAGGHVELDEHPEETVKREVFEELSIHADFLLHNPFFLTVTKTVGQTAGHTDVSLFLKVCSRKGDFLRESYFLSRFAGKIPVPKIIRLVGPEEGLDRAVLMECVQGDLLKSKAVTSDLAWEVGSIS